MKFFINHFLGASLLLAFFATSGCSKNEAPTKVDSISGEELFSYMVDKSEELLCESERILSFTRSDYFEEYDFSVDYENLPDWMAKHIESYLSVSSLEDLDEVSTISNIAGDKSITSSQKVMIADAIAVGFFIHKLAEDSITDTRSDYTECADQCIKAYNRKCARVLALFVVSAGVSAFLAQPEGVVLAGCGAAAAIGQAGDDLEQCMNQCYRDAHD